MKVRDVQHPMLPETTAEEQSRQRAVVSLRKILNARVRSANVRRFEEEGAPAFAARHGRQPQSPEDIERAFFESPGYRMWSAVNRSVQEMIWLSVGEPIFRDRARMQAAASALTESPTKLGALKLDPDSPTALLAALMQVVSADPETMRPYQMAAMRSSLLTTRSRFCMT